MTIFSIDEHNNITAFASQPEAAAATPTPGDTFSSARELAERLADWPEERWAAIWNSLPGVTPVQCFKSPKAAASRIWKRIQGLGTAQPKAAPKAKAGAQSAKAAPSRGQATQKATTAKKAPQSRKAAKSKAAAGPRQGSKTAQVIVLLRRKSGATISEIMQTMGWQRHTVRGFMAGAMPKAGYRVESFKPEGGERTYRLNK
jgi:transglutaminase/protease-like cytokinesis protein 3